jgi:uncharacterized protein YecT (DUF1311 family)
MHRIVLLPLLLAAGVTHATCARNEYGVYEDIACASEAFSSADRELNAAYKKLLQSMDSTQRKNLVLAQRSWLSFLNAQAAFIYAVEGDGSQGRL